MSYTVPYGKLKKALFTYKLDIDSDEVKELFPNVWLNVICEYLNTSGIHNKAILRYNVRTKYFEADAFTNVDEKTEIIISDYAEISFNGSIMPIRDIQIRFKNYGSDNFHYRHAVDLLDIFPDLKYYKSKNQNDTIIQMQKEIQQLKAVLKTAVFN